MDRLNQLRVGVEGGTGRGGDATLDSSSAPSEAYMSANESSKYFSLSDSTFDISPMKDVSLASTAETDHNVTDQDELISNLSPISKKDVMLDSFKIGKQIEAANILSGGVDIFDDNDNSFDGDELVIDDNVEDDKLNLDKESHLDETASEDVADGPVDVPSNDTEVLLQIDGKNVDAIDIGNGLYLYRKAGQEELAAVQIITEDDQQAPSFKFLKVRENAEGNLEVYEEFEIEVSKDVPVKEAKPSVKITPLVPIKDISKIRSESSSIKIAGVKDKTTAKEISSTSTTEIETEVKDPESKTELNLNGKMMKFSESRKSPVVGSFTPMTYHSTPSKEGKPLTKTMVDLQLHPSRHSDNVKKTIEVHTDNQTKKVAADESKPKSESQAKIADNITKEISSTENEIVAESIEQSEYQHKKDNAGMTITVTSNTDRQTVNEEHDDKQCTDEKNMIKVDDIIKPKVDTVELTKVSIDNKSQENEAGTSMTEEVEIKDSDKKENDVILSKTEDSYSPDEKNRDLVNKNMIFASLLGATRVNKILNSNAEKIVGPCVSSSVLEKVNEDTDKKSTKYDVKNLTKIEVNKDVVENTEPKSKTVDEILEKAKENEHKEKSSSQMESSELIDEVSSTSLLEIQKTLQPIETPIDSIADDKIQLVEEKKTSEESSISMQVKKTETTSKQLKDAENKEVKVDSKFKETESKTVLKAENTNLVAKASEPKIEMDLEEKNSSAVQQNEPNVTKLSDENDTKTASQSEKSDKLESKIEPEAVSTSDQLKPVFKGMELKTISKIRKLNPIAKRIETNIVSQTDKLNFAAKPTEPPTISRTEIVNPATKVVTTTASTVEKANVFEDNVELKPVAPTNRFIPIAKGIVPKIVTKTGVLNIEKKIEPMAVSQTEKIIPIGKANEPKTYSKHQKLNPSAKGILSMAVSNIDQVNPITKGFETISKTVILNPVPKEIELKISKSDKAPVAQQMPKNKVVIITSNKIIVPSNVASLANKEINIPQVTSISEAKPINNNQAAVPFGKWTDANRQEFVNKFKEIKVPATSNSKQIKNSNDLNRIDVLKKIDSQRSNTASSKAYDKSNVNDTVFSSKIAPSKVETKIPVKKEGLKLKPKPVDTKNNTKPEGTPTETVSSTVTSNVGISDVGNPESEERREVNVIDLIGKAIVDMLNRPVPMPMTRSPLDEPKQVDKDTLVTKTEANTEPQNLNIDQQKLKTDQQKLNIDQQKLKTEQQKLNVDQQKLKTDQRKLNTDQQKLNIDQKIDEDSSGSLDDIEMKMNELHGIPFVERPPHELPKVYKTYSKSSKDSNQNKGAKNLLPGTSKQSKVHENVVDLESDEEVIEHEPITGDIHLIKKSASKLPEPVIAHVSSENKTAKNEEPVITEKDFDKFARRNSITYENCLTVKFDGKEPANVVQTVKEKDATKVYPRNEMIRMDAQTKLPHKQTTSQIHANKFPNTKFGSVPEDPNNKNYQSKIHSAYQSVMSVKRQMDRPITIIEDKPVKVVFMDANAEFVPNQLNVQGKELSPAKRVTIESAKVSPQPLNSGRTDAIEDRKQDDTKTKTKHQRKQVLNPLEAPELELIQPRVLDADLSPKKKRKTDDSKTEKSPKNLVHKKSYLLGRAVPGDETANSQDVKNPVKETTSQAEILKERTVSAIDSLVKAAELLENQSVESASPNPDSQQNTPVKRGRGRPRKYPLPEGAIDIKIASPSPQKKPRLIDAKPVKQDPISDEESSGDEQMIRENWTIGKINENIVCPICNKLFRSENVVFKHVKHCTGVSPIRSELEKRSPRRRRSSRDSDNKSFESQSEDMEFYETPKERVKSTSKKRKSKESSKADMVDIIVIEDMPDKEQVSKTTEVKPEKPKISKVQARETTENKKEKPKKAADEKPVKEQTLKEIVEEKLSSKKLEENAGEKHNNMVEEAVENRARTKNTEETVEEKPAKGKKLLQTSVQRSSNLVCEFCGKTFRQLSYLSNHKLQHGKEQLKKHEAKLTAKLQVYSCEVCKKEFRKLHHLVQHRIIHNPEVTTRTTRKSSSEQSDTNIKEPPAPKQDDTSAGFRCEPCDKSFRKLHHLVEHRETHDGINRQKINAQTAAPPVEKPPPPPQCDVCKKSFRKLHHLIEHKEQHHVEQVETSSEKSELDDKSVQSSLSTRDIIHECSLCYMVFPNEHSLNKHFVICQQKKKRQSKAKGKPENVDRTDTVEESTNTEDSMDIEDAPKIVTAEIVDREEVEHEQESKSVVVAEQVEGEKPIDFEKKSSDTLPVVKVMNVSEIPVPKQSEVAELKSAPAKRELPKSDDADEKTVIPDKIKKIDDQLVKAKLPKKISAKDKLASTLTKRQKSIAPLPVLPEGKPVESSDDDEARYMLNPNFKMDEVSEEKTFLKVRSNKRNSLQIERPNSRDLMNRRTSLQHPPKIPRLKAKAVEPKVVPIMTKNVLKPAKLEAPSIDSDDSDVKYAFPETVTRQTSNKETPKEKKAPKKSLAEKRKSLSGIAKRKSLGQATAKVNSVPVRIIKRRTLDVEHRCDCGQLFNSAALLSRHTSLAHTPPRIRRRRSPLPGAGAQPATTTQKSTSDQPAKTTRKSSVKPEAYNAKPARKSSANFNVTDTRKSIKSEQSQEKKSPAKPTRSTARKGVPDPETLRNVMTKTQRKRGLSN